MISSSFNIQILVFNFAYQGNLDYDEAVSHSYGLTSKLCE
jgi:hypothetical protein